MAEVETLVKEIGDKLANLTLKQAVDLGGYLKDTYGIEPAAGGVAIAAGPAAAAAAPAEAQTNFDVVLKSVPADKKIQVIKVVREATGLGLKEAKDLVEAAPKVVKEALPKADAEKLAATLKAQGAEVELK